MVINQKRKSKDIKHLTEFNDLLKSKTKDDRTLYFLAYSNIIQEKDFSFFICDLCDVKKKHLLFNMKTFLYFEFIERFERLSYRKPLQV